MDILAHTYQKVLRSPSITIFVLFWNSNPLSNNISSLLKFKLSHHHSGFCKFTYWFPKPMNALTWSPVVKHRLWLCMVPDCERCKSDRAALVFAVRYGHWYSDNTGCPATRPQISGVACCSCWQPIKAFRERCGVLARRTIRGLLFLLSTLTMASLFLARHEL